MSNHDHHDDHHGDHGHHDHPLPPPEPDNISFASLTFWGLASFVSVIVSIALLTGYFWHERTSMELGRADDTSSFGKLRAAQRAEAADKLVEYKELWQITKNGRVEALYNSEGEAKSHVVSGDANAVDGRKIERAGKLQLPISRAMALVAAEGAKPFAKQAAAAPAAPAAAAPAAAPAPFVVDAKLAAQGKALFTSKTCSACHSVDGNRLVGPTMKGIWGRKEKMADGTELYVDEAYFARSIKEPMAQVVEGYPPAMATLPVSDDEIKALLHYVASIK